MDRSEAARIDPAQPLPLILYTPPSITRTAALETLERAGRPWRIVCSSGSLSGLRAAALAGLGITVQARGLMPEGLMEMPAAYRLPDLGDVEFVVLGAARQQRGPAAELAGQSWRTAAGCSGGWVAKRQRRVARSVGRRAVSHSIGLAPEPPNNSGPPFSMKSLMKPGIS